MHLASLGMGSPYFLLLAVGFGLAFWWAGRWGARLDLPRLVVVDACIAALVGGIVGARLLHAAVEPLPGGALAAHEVDDLRARLPALDPAGRAALEDALARPPVAAAWAFVADMPPGWARERAVEAARADPADVPVRWWYLARPGELPQFWKGGLAYLGGLLLASALAGWAVRRHGVAVGRMANLAAPAIALGLVFGRLGCFLEGCCYGAACEAAWWSHPPPWYADLGPALGETPRYPTALLQAAANLGLFAALRARLARGPAAPWEVFCLFLVLYAPARVAIEALRDDPRGGALGLSTSQWLSLALALPGAVAWWWLRARRLASGEDATVCEAAQPEADATPAPRGVAPPGDVPPPGPDPA